MSIRPSVSGLILQVRQLHIFMAAVPPPDDSMEDNTAPDDTVSLSSTTPPASPHPPLEPMAPTTVPSIPNEDHPTGQEMAGHSDTTTRGNGRVGKKGKGWKRIRVRPKFPRIPSMRVLSSGTVVQIGPRPLMSIPVSAPRHPAPPSTPQNRQPMPTAQPVPVVQAVPTAQPVRIVQPVPNPQPVSMVQPMTMPMVSPIPSLPTQHPLIAGSRLSTPTFVLVPAMPPCSIHLVPSTSSATSAQHTANMPSTSTDCCNTCHRQF